jgi:hypothetical protein
VFAELFEGLLSPDEVVFAVLLRGYGVASEPPQWNEISTTLQQMERKNGIQPSTGEVQQMDRVRIVPGRHWLAGREKLPASASLHVDLLSSILPAARCRSHLQRPARVLHQEQRR